MADPAPRSAPTPANPSTMNLLQELTVDCPWCGETFVTLADTSEGDHSHIEDCTVCCRPISIWIECAPGEIFSSSCERP